MIVLRDCDVICGGWLWCGGVGGGGGGVCGCGGVGLVVGGWVVGVWCGFVEWLVVGCK